jgi:Rrf2 family protein
MISLTRKTEYALVALWHLARNEDRLCSANEISSTHNAPNALMMNILKSLSSSGIISSVRGARGGYRLALAPSELTMKSLIEVLEGPIRLVRCAGEAEHSEDSGCDFSGMCPIQGPALRLHLRLEEFLDRITLEEMFEEFVPLGVAGSMSATALVDAAKSVGGASRQATATQATVGTS